MAIIMRERLIIEKRIEPGADTSSYDHAAKVLNKENPGAVVIFAPRTSSESLGKRYLFTNDDAGKFSYLVWEHSARKEKR